MSLSAKWTDTVNRLALPIGLAVAGVVLVFALGWLNGGMDKAEAIHQARVEEALRTAKPHHARVDSLRLLAAVHVVATQEKLAREARLKVFSDSVRASLASLPADTVVPLRIVRRVIETYEARVALLHEAMLSLDSARVLEAHRADISETRVTHLETLLEQDPARCRVLFLRCPSRGAMLLGGVVLGGATVLLLSRR